MSKAMPTSTLNIFIVSRAAQKVINKVSILLESSFINVPLVLVILILANNVSL